MAAALAGCKILKEMARLESEAESARSMKEAKYEQFALGECTKRISEIMQHTNTHIQNWVTAADSLRWDLKKRGSKGWGAYADGNKNNKVVVNR